MLEDAPTEATVTATVAGGKVTGLTVGHAGTGYLKAPAILISGGGGSGATASATIANGGIAAVHVTAGGKNYTSAPTVTVGGPTSKRVVTSLWSNDNTSVAGSEPGAAVSLQVVDKYYSALLGYTGLPHMAALPGDVLLNLDARVRVWAKTGAIFHQILPDQPLHTIAYAEQATYADKAGTVADGAISAAQIAERASPPPSLPTAL